MLARETQPRVLAVRSFTVLKIDSIQDNHSSLNYWSLKRRSSTEKLREPMNQGRSLTPISTLWLGAINGLLVGLAIEVARVAYLNYQMDLAARQYTDANYWADFDSARWEPLTPLVGLLVFAVVSFLVRKYFMHRPRLLLSLWFGLGGSAIALGYFMSTRSAELLSFLWLFGLVALTYLAHRLWRSYRESPPLVWAINAISAVIVVAIGVQLVGLFFYWPDLRKPLIWLVALVGAAGISSVFGVVVELISNRFKWRKSEASAQ